MTCSQNRAVYTFRKHKAVKGLATVALATALLGLSTTTYANETATTTTTAENTEKTPQDIAQEIKALKTEIANLESDLASLKTLATPEAIREQIDQKQASLERLISTTETLPSTQAQKTDALEAVQTEAAETEQALATAKKDLAQAQMDATKAEKDVAKLTTAVDDKAQAVDTLTGQLSDATNKVSDLSTQLTAIDTTLNQDKPLSTKETVDTLTAEVRDKTAALATTTSNIENIEKQVSDLDQKLNDSTRKLVLSETYIQALKDYYNYNLTSDERAAAKRILAQEGKILNQTTTEDYFNVFFEEVSEEKFNINNLPQEVLVELNEYAKEIVNDVRKQVGQKEVVLSNSSIEFAKRVTNEYNKQNWSFGQRHSSIAVNTAGQHYNLKYTENTTIETGRQSYEDLFSFGNDRQEYSLDQLKTLVFISLHDFVVNENEWLHAGDITGLRNSKTNETTTYFGLSFNQSTDLTSVHVLQVDNEDIQEPSVFDKTYANPNSKDKLREQRVALVDQLTDLKEQQDKQAQDLTVTKTSLALAEEGYLNKQNDDKLRERKTLLNGQLADATKTKETLTTELTRAQTDLATAQDSLSEKEELKVRLDGLVTTTTNIVNLLTAKSENFNTQAETLAKEIADIDRQHCDASRRHRGTSDP